MTNPPVGPRFRLAPGTVLRGGRRPPLPPTPATGTPPFRNTRWDRAALSVSLDPVWLLAPLFTRDAAGLRPDDAGPGAVSPAVPRIPVTDMDLAACASDWPTWWSAALSYRPGTPAPRPEDLIGDSPALQRLWAALARPWADWVGARPPRRPDSDARAKAVERAVLTGFADDNGREPGRWTVRILEIPVTGSYLHSPEDRRIVVSAALRADPGRYRDALTAELPRHF